MTGLKKIKTWLNCLFKKKTPTPNGAIQDTHELESSTKIENNKSESTKPRD